MINLDKSDFMKQELFFVDFFLSQGNLNMEQDKVDVILCWPTPKATSDVRSFHGLVQYYRKFIRKFSRICAPMLDTTKGGMKEKFLWTPHDDKGFETLKKKIIELPTLLLPSFDKLSQVECDSSNVAIGDILS